MTSSLRMICLVVLVMSIASPVWAKFEGPAPVFSIEMAPKSDSDKPFSNYQVPLCDSSCQFCYSRYDNTLDFPNGGIVANGILFSYDSVDDQIITVRYIGERNVIDTGCQDSQCFRTRGIKVYGFNPYHNEILLQRNMGAIGRTKIFDLAFLNDNLDIVRRLHSRRIAQKCHRDNIEFLEDHFRCFSQRELYSFDYDGNEIADKERYDIMPKVNARLVAPHAWIYQTKRGSDTATIFYNGKAIELPEGSAKWLGGSEAPMRWKVLKVVEGAKEKNLFIALFSLPIKETRTKPSNSLKFIAIDEQGEIVDRVDFVPPIKFGRHQGSYVSERFEVYAFYTIDGPCPSWIESAVETTKRMYPGRKEIIEACSMENCCGGEFVPERLLAFKWEWKLPEGMSFKKINASPRKPNDDAKWSDKDDYEELVRRVEEFDGEDSVHVDEMIDSFYKAPVTVSEEPVERKVIPKVSEPEPTLESAEKPYVPVVTIIALLSALIVSVLVIRRRGQS